MGEPIGRGHESVLRHTFCSDLGMKGAAARAIQELAGQSQAVVLFLLDALTEAAIGVMSATAVINGRR